MIDVKVFYDALINAGVTRFSGVPDSLLKSFCAYVTDNTRDTHHKITANEGSAIGLAVGQYLATSKPSLVYMQNSGFGNAINPLLSLADSKVYGIPMVILMGWRGEPDVPDEPQHVKQGEIMESLLRVCDIPTAVIDSSTSNVANLILDLVSESVLKSQPVVILVKKGTFCDYKLSQRVPDIAQSSREDAIEAIITAVERDSVFVSTTGMPSRELFELRVRRGEGHNNDFLTVGSMGHASMIALGVASNTEKRVVCIDGDGASIMHLGNLSSVGQSGASNLIHVVLNNAAHDSVGGQPTCADSLDLTGIAGACGYASAQSFTNLSFLVSYIRFVIEQPGPHFIEVKIRKGARANLGRPTSSPDANKRAFMASFGG